MRYGGNLDGYIGKSNVLSDWGGYGCNWIECNGTLDHNANIGFQSRSRYSLMSVAAYILVAVRSKMFTIQLLYDTMIHMIFCTMVVCYIVLLIGEAMLW